MACKYCGKEANKQNIKEEEMEIVANKKGAKQAGKAGEQAEGTQAAEEAMVKALNLAGSTEEKLAEANVELAKATAEGAPEGVMAVWEQKVKILEKAKEEEAKMEKPEKAGIAKAKETKKETKKEKVEKAIKGQAEAKAAKKAEKAKAPKEPKEPKPKKQGIECLCGCGATTNPGREFRMGHDAKFKSMIRKYVRKETKLTDLPERVQHLIKTNHAAVVKAKAEMGDKG